MLCQFLLSTLIANLHPNLKYYEMKKVLFSLAASILISACADKQPKEITLSGQLANQPDNFGLLMSKGLTDTISINEDGSFHFTKSLNEPSYFTFRVGRVAHIIFLFPGDNLVINLDLETRTNDPVFSGTSADINQYILKSGKVSRGLMSDFRGLYSLPVDTFTAKIDSVKGEISSILEDEKISDPKFISLEKDRIEFWSKGLMYDYPAYNARILGKTFNPDSADYSFMINVDFNLSKYLNMNEYASLVNEHIQNIHWTNLAKEESKGKSRFEQKIMLFDLIDSLIQNPEVRDYVKHQSVIETILWESLDDAKNLVEHYMKEVVILP